MRQVRNNIFESNSSSVHSIAISKEPVDIQSNKTIWFDVDEFGWSFDCAEPSDYLYTAIWYQYYDYCDDKSEFYERIDRLKSVLDKHNIDYHFKDPEKCDGYIDHCYELTDFIDTILDDEDMLLRFLFNPKSGVYTGNDNDGCYDDMCWAADDTTWDDNSEREIPNPNHDKTNFEYFFKGN